MSKVVFNATLFRSLYPQFEDATVYTDAVLNAAFDEAVVILGNEGSPLPYDPANRIYTRQIALDKATCHILTLKYLQPQDQPGRLASATQGSVSTSFDLLKTGSYTGDWWAQTACGRALWALLLPYIMGGRFYTGSKFHPWG